MSGGPRTLKIAIAVAATIGALAVPGAASADPVGDVVNGVNDTVSGLLGSGSGDSGDSGGSGVAASSGGGSGGGPAHSPSGASAPDADRGGTPPNYTPPAHGTDPHATGTGAVIDIAPQNATPLPYSPGGGSEDVVVGSSHGSQNPDGSYHGHVTILTLFGNELIPGADTGPGQTSDGPAGDLNALLGQVCNATDLCLSVLDVNSQTTDSGSQNSFSAASADLALAGAPVVNATAVNSQGNMQESGGCQTASSSSSVASAELVGIGVADALNASSTSTACNNGSSSQTSDSSGVVALGQPVPLPVAGCANGTPNSVFNPPVVGLVVSAVCNADDSGGSQLPLPYGVREALSVFVLPVLGDPLVKVTAAAAESHAVAPPADGDDGDGGDGPGGPGGPNRPGDGGVLDRDDDGIPNAQDECPGTPGPASNDGCPIGDRDGDGIPDDEDACPDVPGPASNDGCPFGGGPTGKGPDNLAFTGANLLAIGLIGLGVMGAGLGLMGLGDRRRRLSRG